MRGKYFTLSGLFAAILPEPLQAAAHYVGTCSEVVGQAMSEMNGRLLSVRSHEDRCTLAVLVTEPGKRPEKRVIRVFINDGSAPVRD